MISTSLSEICFFGTIVSFPFLSSSYSSFLLTLSPLLSSNQGLSLDPVSKLQKKIELAQQKVLAVQATKKPNFEAEVDKIAGQIEAAQAEVAGWMARRGVIRSM